MKEPTVPSGSAVSNPATVAVVSAAVSRTECDSPCCCTWCGGAIIQVAAVGFLSFSTLVAWPVGMVFAYAYAGLMLWLAKYLERRIQREPSNIASSVAKEGRSMLYISSMVYLFIGGMFIPINVFSKSTEFADPLLQPLGDRIGENDLVSALPEGASPELKQWAAPSTCYADEIVPGWAMFDGTVYLSSETKSNVCGSRRSLLQVKDGSSQTASVAATLSPLYDAYAFVEFNDALYFSAVADDTGRELFYANKDGIIAAAPEVRTGEDSGEVKALIVESDQLYFKARATQASVTYWGGWSLNSTGELTELVVVTPEARASTEDEAAGTTAAMDQPPVTAILFFAVLPHFICSCKLFQKSVAPGLMVNIATGGAMSLINVYAIFTGDHSLERFPFRAFFTTFCTIGIAFAVLAKIRGILDDDAISWLLNVNALTLFITLHFVLELPMASDPWRYVIYDMLLMIFAVVSIVSQSIVPMICCACGLFVTFWRVSSVLGDSNFANLLRFAGVALLGVGVVLGAVFLAKESPRMRAYIDEKLKCCKPPPKPTAGEKDPIVSP